MGHTNRSQRQVMDQILVEFEQYIRSLRPEKQKRAYALLNKAKVHFGNVSFANSYHAWALILFSMMIED